MAAVGAREAGWPRGPAAEWGRGLRHAASSGNVLTRPAGAAALWAGATGRGPTPGPCAESHPPQPRGPRRHQGQDLQAGTASCSGRRDRAPVFSRSPSTSPSTSVLGDGWPCGRVPARTGTEGTQPAPGHSRSLSGGPHAAPPRSAGRRDLCGLLREPGAAGHGLSPVQTPRRSKRDSLHARPHRGTRGLTAGWGHGLHCTQLRGRMRRCGGALQGRTPEPPPQAPPAPLPEASPGHRCSGIARNVTTLPVITPR